MITCVDCSRVLLNDVKPFDPRTTPTYRAQVHTQIRAARHQHTCPKGTAMQDQCSRCDSVSDCLDSGITTLEDVAGVIGAPAPSLHVHLVQHDRDDLLRGMTYGGEPILPSEPEPAAEVAEIEAVPEVEERSCACDKWVFDEGEDDYRETLEDGLTILHKVEQCIETNARRMDDHVLEVPSEWADEVQRLAQADAEERPSLDDLVHPDPEDSLAWLCGHEDREIREAAIALHMLLTRRKHDNMLQAKIERLTVERDHLTQRIEEMRAALQGEPEPEPVPLAAQPVKQHPTTAEIRAWCVANGVPVPSRGTLPRTAVEAYEAAQVSA